MPVFALTWRCDGSEGIHWHILGIREDGRFYGDIRNYSSDPTLRRGTAVSGQLSHDECKRLIALVQIINNTPPPVEAGSHFAALFERLLPNQDVGVAQRLFEYHLGDEEWSESAQAFVELAGLVEKHLSPFYEKLLSPG